VSGWRFRGFASTYQQNEQSYWSPDQMAAYEAACPVWEDAHPDADAGDENDSYPAPPSSSQLHDPIHFGYMGL
jgi:hypothetical protein